MSPVKIPAEAYEAYEREVAEQLAAGRQVTVSLRVFIRPSRRKLTWKVVLDETVLDGGEAGWPQIDVSTND